MNVRQLLRSPALYVVVAALVLRIVATTQWHVPAGDGVQYYKLSQQLAAHQRLAYDDKSPLSYSRMPGYPLFLAFVAVGTAPLDMNQHLVRATRANLVLDLITALCVFLLVRLYAPQGIAATLALAFVLFHPLGLLLCCYGLTESLVTCLLTIAFCAGVAADRRWWLPLVAGLATGLALLVRVDAVLHLPVLAFVVWRATRRSTAGLGQALRVNGRAALLFTLCAAIPYGLWPLRNLQRFGAPHLFGTEWIAQNGDPLPTGYTDWVRSWSGAAPGDAYSLLLVVNRMNLDPNRLIQPQMVDNDDERARVAALMREINKSGMTPAVSDGFKQLVAERRARHPFRHFVGLPARRLVELWKPVPDYDFPMKVPALGLPAGRRVFDWLGQLLLLGAAILLPFAYRKERALTTIIVAMVLLRSAAMAWLPPSPNQRYVVELFPLLAVIVGLGVARIRERREAS